MKHYNVLVLASTVAVAAVTLTPSNAQTISPFAARQRQTMVTAWESKREVPQEFDLHTVLVQFRASSTNESRDRSCRKVGLGAMQTYTLVPGLALVHVSGDPRASVLQLRADPNVLHVELNQVLHTQIIPNDPLLTNAWGLNNATSASNDIDAPQAWDLYTGDPNYRIAVIDTGIDFNHPDLQGNIWTNPAEPIDGIDNDGNGFIDDNRGWNFFGNTRNAQDDNGHGTHVSGTIAAKGNNGIGVAGVVWAAKIVPLKFLNSAGSGTLADAIRALDYCSANGIKISNNSWGGGMFDSVLQQAIINAGLKDHLFIVAAGNSALNMEISPSYPASYNLANMINVAATTRTGLMASFSNYGLQSVHVGAPGLDVYSTWPTTFPTAFPTGYNQISGTSMAAPHVTGLVALLRGKMPSWTAAQVKAAILSTVSPLASLAGKTITGGQINAFKSLQSTIVEAIPPTVAVTRSIAAPVSGWNTTNVTVTVTGTDNVGGSGINNIQTSINGGGTVTTSGPVATVLVSNNGVSNITYFATDHSSNVSPVGTVTIRVDKTAPVTNVSAVVGLTSTVVTLAATDATSGVVSTVYSLDGAPETSYTGPITVDNGIHTVTTRSTDLAGNIEALKSLSLPLGALQTVAINPATVTGGANATGTLTLASPAPAGGTTVALSTNLASVGVPATINIVAGATTTTFPVTTTAVGNATAVIITAVAGSISKTTTLTVNPVPAAALSSVTLNTASTRGRRTPYPLLTVTLTSAATSPILVTLRSSSALLATVPLSVTIPSGALTATVTVTTLKVNANTSVILTATQGTLVKTVTLGITK